MRVLRKALLFGALAFSAAVCHAQGLTVTLLGTGTPPPYPERAGPATLVQAGSETLLFDTGRGVATRLFQKNIAPDAITAHFFTHLHSDHTVGLPDLWLTGWFGRPWPGRTVPLVVFGPPGTQTMTDHLTKAFDEDIRIRTQGQGLPADGVKFVTREFNDGGVLYERNGVKVTAIEVNHGGELIPAFGFVIEYDGRKVVLSGDATYDRRLVEAAAGAQLFVHSVALIEPELLKARPILNETLKHFATPEQVGQVFAQAKPLLGAYTHIVYYTAEPGSEIPEATLLKRTQSSYPGAVVMGRDLMAFEVGRNDVAAYDESGKQILKVNR